VDREAQRDGRLDAAGPGGQEAARERVAGTGRVDRMGGGRRIVQRRQRLAQQEGALRPKRQDQQEVVLRRVDEGLQVAYQLGRCRLARPWSRARPPGSG
jgi:hypothetical protein